MSKSIISVSGISKVKEDKNKKSYKTVEFSTPSTVSHIDMETGELIKLRVQPKRTAINLYEESYLDSNPQFGWDFQLGERTFGDVVTRKVTPYQIPTLDKDGIPTGSRTVDTSTTVVFGDSEAANWESLVKNAFKSRGHEILEAIPASFSLAPGQSVDSKVEATF